MSDKEIRTLNRICVFCGSSEGHNPIFRHGAAELGNQIALSGATLVYGGGGTGLMGTVANAALAAGGEVIGVIPSGLARKEVAHEGITSMHVVDSMHERKALMSDLSDAFVAMPGGFGTFEELLESITWAQLGIHHKPVGVLNINRYFDPLLQLIDGGVREGFIGAPFRALICEADEAGDLLEELARHRLPDTKAWMTPREA